MEPLINTLSFEKLRQAKQNASKSLKALSIDLSSSTVGNLVANTFGYQDWNTASASLKNGHPILSIGGRKIVAIYHFEDIEHVGFINIDQIRRFKIATVDIDDEQGWQLHTSENSVLAEGNRRLHSVRVYVLEHDGNEMSYTLTAGSESILDAKKVLKSFSEWFVSSTSGIFDGMAVFQK